MKNRFIKFFLCLIVLLSALFPINANNNELKNIFVNAVPKSWVRVPDDVLYKELQRVRKIANTKFAGDALQFNLLKTDDYFNAPSITIVFTNEESPTNSELLSDYNDYGEKILNTFTASIEKVSEPSSNLKIEVLDKKIAYDSLKNILTANILLRYINTYGEVEQVFVNKILFTKNTVIMIQGGFFYDKNAREYISQFNNYVNSIEIPANYKIYDSWLAKKIDLLNELLPVLLFLLGLLFLIIISIFLENRYPKNKALTIITKSFLFIFRITFKTLIRTSASSSTPTNNSDTTNVDTHSIDDAHSDHHNHDSDSLKHNNFDAHSIDDSLSENNLDDILSDNTKIDNYLSRDTQLDDLLSDNKDIEELLHNAKNK